MNKRHYKIPKLKILGQYEFVNIIRETLGATNEFGERIRTYATTLNVKIFISPISADLRMESQGLVSMSSHNLIATTGVSIIARDKVVDYDNNIFDVVETTDWQTHKEAYLKINEKV